MQDDICRNNHGGNPFSDSAYHSTSSEKREAMRRAIFKFAATQGELGITADEATAHFGAFHNSIAPRISELKRDFYLIETNFSRATRTGRQARVYIANPDMFFLARINNDLKNLGDKIV